MVIKNENNGVLPCVGGSLPSRESIRKIIELTAHDYNGYVWGNDTVLGTMEKLIDAAMEILRNES
jgi:hypothetical protein